MESCLLVVESCFLLSLFKLIASNGNGKRKAIVVQKKKKNDKPNKKDSRSLEFLFLNFFNNQLLESYFLGLLIH